MSAQFETYSHGMVWEEEYGYSQAVRVSDTLYVSGQLSHDETGSLIGEGNFSQQIEIAFKNLDKVLRHYGVGRNQVVSTTVLAIGVQDHFMDIAAAHKSYFSAHRPVSTAMGVAGLAFPGQLVEISAIVHLVRA